jgi:hypothetical protein
MVMTATAEIQPPEIHPAEVPTARADTAPTVDVCGKRTLDYVIECLAYLNRSPKDREGAAYRVRTCGLPRLGRNSRAE